MKNVFYIVSCSIYLRLLLNLMIVLESKTLKHEVSSDHLEPAVGRCSSSKSIIHYTLMSYTFLLMAQDDLKILRVSEFYSPIL